MSSLALLLIKRIKALQDESYQHHWETYTYTNECLGKRQRCCVIQQLVQHTS
ncbi:MAG: hypothetical protein V7K54_15035 [Nostoc sp.]